MGLGDVVVSIKPGKHLSTHHHLIQVAALMCSHESVCEREKTRRGGELQEAILEGTQLRYCGIVASQTGCCSHIFYIYMEPLCSVHKHRCGALR